MNVFEEVKSRLSVSEVIGNYLPIDPAGQNYKCLCPFHNDKKPSLIISDQKEIWHCFSCGAGGDVFKFVMDYENLSKGEALQKLAKMAGVKLPKINSQNKEKETSEFNQAETKTEFELGFNYLFWASKVFHQILLKAIQNRNSQLSQYLLKRKLSLETIQKFQIGFAPSNNFLMNLIQKHNLQSSQDLFLKIGLLKQLESGQIKDKFSNRLMIPVFDENEKVVGFTGRVLPGEKIDRPKYLNSSESQWFKKRKIWYGWSHNLKQIKEQKQVLIVEGNMDVLASFPKNIPALASQGTSFTPSQIKRLKFLQSEIILAFDNDEAGQTAADKFFTQASFQNLQIKKILIPEKFKDLDEWLASSEFDPKKPLPIQDFLESWINKNKQKLTSSNLQIKKESVENFLNLLIVRDNLEQDFYLKKLAQITNFSLEALKISLQKKPVQKQNYEPDSDQTETFQIPKRADQKEQGLRVAFQKVSVFFWQNQFKTQEQNQIQKQRLENLFVLLKSCLSNQNPNHFLAEFTDLESFLKIKEQEFSLFETITSEEKDIGLKIISSFLNQNISQILLDSNLKKMYLESFV